MNARLSPSSARSNPTSPRVSPHYCWRRKRLARMRTANPECPRGRRRGTLQPALTSAATLSAAAVIRLLMVLAAPPGALVAIVSAAPLGFLGLLDAGRTWAGRSNVLHATARPDHILGAPAMVLRGGVRMLVGGGTVV